MFWLEHVWAKFYNQIYNNIRYHKDLMQLQQMLNSGKIKPNENFHLQQGLLLLLSVLPEHV